MPSVQYGKKIIHFTIHEQTGLKSHYISVARGEGVILKGAKVPNDIAQKLILKKAGWIIDKLERVKAKSDDSIVTGSRITYLGKQYYAEVKVSKAVETAKVEFNYSTFKIFVNPEVKPQPAIRRAIDTFYKEKAIEKIAPRVKKWSERTDLEYTKLKFVKMAKRWGSCTPENNIIINSEAVKLPMSLIDYLIVHELCHVKVKDHSKRFWKEMAKHMPKWREYDERFKKSYI